MKKLIILALCFVGSMQATIPYSISGKETRVLSDDFLRVINVALQRYNDYDKHPNMATQWYLWDAIGLVEDFFNFAMAELGMRRCTRHLTHEYADAHELILVTQYKLFLEHVRLPYKTLQDKALQEIENSMASMASFSLEDHDAIA